MDRWRTLETHLDKLRQTSQRPWWQVSYGVFLLQRGREYQQLELVSEADLIHSRLEKWLQRWENEQDQPTRQTVKGLQVSLWTAERLQRLLLRIRSELDHRRMLIPAPERQNLMNRLDRVQHLLEQQECAQAQEELETVRTAWIRRQARSYRAWSAIRSVTDKDGVSRPVRDWQTARRDSNAQVGPYNSRWNLEDCLGLVGERDPIWVEDFFETYYQLIQYAEKLGDLVPAARKKSSRR